MAPIAAFTPSVSRRAGCAPVPFDADLGDADRAAGGAIGSPVTPCGVIGATRWRGVHAAWRRGRPIKR
jgi:hypothetical protein